MIISLSIFIILQNSLSEENRTVRNRVHSLTEAVTELCTHFSSSATDDEEDDDSYDNDFTDDYYDHDTLHDTNIPFQRIHSLPAPLTNGWHEEEEEENEDEKDVASLSWHFDTNHELISRRILPCIITVDSTSQEYDDTSEEEIAIGKDEDLYSHQYIVSQLTFLYSLVLGLLLSLYSRALPSAACNL